MDSTTPTILKVELPPLCGSGFVTPKTKYRTRIKRREVEVAKAYLTTQKRLSAPSMRYPSYKWVEIISAWASAVGLAEKVSNGALILAAVELGLPVQQMHRHNPNAYIGVAKSHESWALEPGIADLGDAA